MNIFLKIKNSVYGPKYYDEVVTKPFSYSLKYYVCFGLLFALAFAIVVTVKFIPTESFIFTQSSKISDYFPQNLSINIKNGEASTNVAQPYFLKLPSGLKIDKSTHPEMANLENLLVIDTKDKFDVDTFNSYKTFLLLTSDSIVYLNNNGQITINSLKSAKDVTLNRDSAVNLVDKFKPLLYFIYPLVFVGSYIVGFVAVLATLICLLIEALLIWLVAKIKGLKLGYIKSFQLGMHLMTSAIIITSLIDIIPVKFTIPFLFTILIIIFALLNLRRPLDTFSKKE